MKGHGVKGHGLWLEVALAIYRQSLWLLPKVDRLRDRHSDRLEMLRLFEDLARRGQRRRGGVGVALVLARGLADSARTAFELRRMRRARRARGEVSGNVQLATNSRRREGPMWRLTQDFQTAWRSVLRRPMLALAAVATMAIGIGASVAMFSVVYGVLLRPLGLEDPDRLVNIRQHAESDPHDASGLSPGLYGELTRRLTTTDSVGAWLYDSATLERGGFYKGDVVEVRDAIVTSTNFFEVLGIRPSFGRLFLEEDAVEGGGRGSAVVLGRGFFENTFGGDESVVGNTLVLDGEPMTVVGVASEIPPAPVPGTDLWIAHGLDPRDRSLTRRIYPIARLSEGVTLEQNRADLAAIYDGLAEEQPALARWTASPSVFRADLLGGVQKGLWTSFVGIGLLLLLASANFANLMMARLSTRRADLSTRACLGASRGALFKQLTVESLLVSGLGAVLGVFLALGIHRYLVTMAGEMLPRLSEVRIDTPVLAFALVLAVVCGTVFGNAPAALGVVGTMRPEALRVRRNSGASDSGLRGGLAVTQVAIAVVLLTAAVLLVSSFRLLSQSDPGFDPERVATAQIYLDDDRYGSLEEEIIYFDKLQERLEALPGVESVATTSSLPMDPDAVDYDLPYRRADQPADPEAEPPQAYYRVSSPGYFETVGIPLKAGRTFVASDLDGPPTVIINRSLARQAWPEVSPVGRQLVVGFAGTVSYEVVGVVADTSFSALGVPAKPEMYFPTPRVSFGGRSVVVKTRSDPMEFVPLIRDTALSIDPNQPVTRATTLARLTADSVATERFYSSLSTGIGLLALLLAASGVYSLIAFWVSQSRFEMGIRMSVGATRLGIMRLVLGQGLKLVGVGCVVGIAASLLLLGNLRALLYEVAPLDARSLVVAVAVLTLAALLASVVPAYVASRSNPVLLLRD